MFILQCIVIEFILKRNLTSYLSVISYTYETKNLVHRAKNCKSKINLDALDEKKGRKKILRKEGTKTKKSKPKIKIRAY